MIALFTDFGLNGPYVGQMHAVLAQAAPSQVVVDLLHDVPRCNVRAGAYLLPGLVAPFPDSSVFLCIVDPGVGGARRAVAVRADGRWFVGPDNGLFHVLAKRALRLDSYEILWRPARLSSTFHGRDLFAPVAASLARGILPESRQAILTAPDGGVWPDDLPEVIYIDGFGNAFTGLQAGRVDAGQVLQVRGRMLRYADTFSTVARGEAFWYRNSGDLVAIAVNEGSAAEVLGLRLGDPIGIQ
ncbi:MAG: SAM hydrolase/SAM-dependent halogenase family protein [Acidiferrobacterales bacterium]